MLKHFKSRKLSGFTLLELVVVIVVIGILAAVAIPTFQGVINRAHDAAAQTTLTAITEDAKILYAMEQGSTPADWYAAFTTAASEVTASTTSIRATANLELAIDVAASDVSGSDYQVLLTDQGYSLPLTGESTSTAISVSVDEVNNLVGVAYLTAANHCAFTTTPFSATGSIQAWSVGTYFGANCKGSVALLGQAETVGNAAGYAMAPPAIQAPAAGTISNLNTTYDGVTFDVSFHSTATAPIQSLELYQDGQFLTDFAGYVNDMFALPTVNFESDMLGYYPGVGGYNQVLYDGLEHTYQVKAINTIGATWSNILTQAPNQDPALTDNSVLTNTPDAVEVLVIAGGGGGGHYSGGGGAGGVLYNANYTVTSGIFNITVGLGGALGNNGQDSSFAGTVTALGGGGGNSAGPGNNGGSGGAGSGYTGNGDFAGGLALQTFLGGTIGYGNSAGHGDDGAYRGGGGGGAGSAGQDATDVQPGNGGDGTNLFSVWATATASGVSGYYAAGGAGGGYWDVTDPVLNRPQGGLGGGANGTGRMDMFGSQKPTPNTGSGGSGSSDSPTANGTAGASGIVIIRYPSTFGPVVASTAHTYVAGGYRYYKFLRSGSIRFTN